GDDASPPDTPPPDSTDSRYAATTRRASSSSSSGFIPGSAPVNPFRPLGVRSQGPRPDPAGSRGDVDSPALPAGGHARASPALTAPAGREHGRDDGTAASYARRGGNRSTDGRGRRTRTPPRYRPRARPAPALPRSPAAPLPSRTPVPAAADGARTQSEPGHLRCADERDRCEREARPTTEGGGSPRTGAATSSPRTPDPARGRGAAPPTARPRPGSEPAPPLDLPRAQLHASPLRLHQRPVLEQLHQGRARHEPAHVRPHRHTTRGRRRRHPRHQLQREPQE